MENRGGETSAECSVGIDRVIILDDAVIIHARHELIDWRVREFCRHPIFFDGRKYYLRARQPADPPFAFRYELIPWPDDLHEESTISFTYDAAAVARRDSDWRRERRHNIIWYALLPFYPLLGFCWSGFKERVLLPLGFEPVSVTSASTMFTFLFVFWDAIMIGFLGGGVLVQALLKGPHQPVLSTHGWLGVLDFLLVAVLSVDCVVRYSQIIRGDERLDGFLQWIFQRSKRH